jgi:thiamine-phosphate pyrophosphorylase
MDASIKGLYAVTPDGIEPAQLLELVDAAIAGGAALIQYRDKSASDIDLKRRGQALMALCRARRVPLIINDHVELARELCADGVHVGEHDLALGQARQLLGHRSLIGVSCYQSIELAARAAATGASYLAFGSVFASIVKPHAKLAPLSLFKEARDAGIELPLVAIGGVDDRNAPALLAAGANAVAVISGVFKSLQPDAVFVQARRLSLLFES